MKGKKQGNALPKRLKRGVERFERWRATRQKRRIPDALWKVAEGLASEFRVHRTNATAKRRLCRTFNARWISTRDSRWRSRSSASCTTT